MILIVIIIGCTNQRIVEEKVNQETSSNQMFSPTEVVETFQLNLHKFIQIDLTQFEEEPKEWGENGSGYAEELVSYLIDEQVPATIFVNERWINESEKVFLLFIN